ncbi:MAG: hypothetical protein QNJ40_00780 [Xanthomonadales bacterium]|nr:hypothetical protein [Xanthomonadales bacterium]
MNRVFRAAIVAACLSITPVIASENDGTTGKSFSNPTTTMATYWQAIACKYFGVCQAKPATPKSENDGTTTKSENDGTTGD